MIKHQKIIDEIKKQIKFPYGMEKTPKEIVVVEDPKNGKIIVNFVTK